MEYDYQDIAPYRDQDVPHAIRALMEELSFLKVLRFVYPDKDDEQIIHFCKDIRTVADFQRVVAYPAMKLMNEKTITEMTSSGLETVDDQACLYISNHRDIILDSALLNMLLHEHEQVTTETAIGSNLLKNPTVRHLTKLNKNFTVNRDANRREMYEHSLKLSHYIRDAITERNVSVWISQREGRAKDGNDRTQQGLLKMLAMSSEEDIIPRFKALRMRPLALSYEYDPCDRYKVVELLKTQEGEQHEKDDDEDLMNIVAGISQNKGRVHLALGEVLDTQLDDIDASISVNDQIQQIAELIDSHIHAQAKLWPNNYVAADLLAASDDYHAKYREADKVLFEVYLDQIIIGLPRADKARAKKILLEKYAYPLLNQIAVSQ